MPHLETVGLAPGIAKFRLPGFSKNGTPLQAAMTNLNTDVDSPIALVARAICFDRPRASPFGPKGDLGDPQDPNDKRIEPFDVCCRRTCVPAGKASAQP